MNPNTRDDLLMSGMGIILVLACIGLGTIILSLAGCTPVIHGPAVSLSTTVHPPCPCPSPGPGGVGPSGAIGPRP